MILFYTLYNFPRDKVHLHLYPVWRGQIIKWIQSFWPISVKMKEFGVKNSSNEFGSEKKFRKRDIPSKWATWIWNLEQIVCLHIWWDDQRKLRHIEIEFSLLELCFAYQSAKKSSNRLIRYSLSYLATNKNFTSRLIIVDQIRALNFVQHISAHKVAFIATIEQKWRERKSSSWKSSLW